MSSKNKFFFFRRFFAIIIFFRAVLPACSCLAGSPHGEAAGKQAAGEFLIKDDSGAETEPRKVFVYDPHNKRDPFLPLVSSEGVVLEPHVTKDREGKPQLEGIIYEAGGSSYAVVNGEVVKTGDTYGSYQVLEIRQEKVIFIKGSEKLEVELKKED